MIEWLPTKDYGRFPYRYLADAVRCLARFETLTYNNLPWGDDYDYVHGFPEEYERWLGGRDLDKTYLFVQHDVDMFPERTLRIVELEAELGVKSNLMIFRDYHDRAHLELTGKLGVEEYLTDEVIKRLQEYEKLGFVIGYHINAYEQANFDLEKAHRKFEEDVSYLRKLFDIRFCSAHGGAKDGNGKSNYILNIPDGLDIRWVNNYHSIKCSRSYSDSLLFRKNQTAGQFLGTCMKGNRYHLLTHPQYYHSPYKTWKQ